MNTLDFIIILAAALAAVAGWRAGIAARLVGWVGIGLGLVVGLRLVPVVTKWFDPDEQGLQFAVAAAVVVLGAMVGQSIGQVLGSKLHTVMPAGPWKVADRSAGVLASLALVVVGVWFSADPLKHSVGWPASQARESVLVASVSDALPKPPDVVAEIRETMAGRFPEVFSGAAPEIELGTAPTSVDMTNATRARVLRSVVKVEGPACGHLSQGSGFVVRAGLVMTNAHVVAGMTEPVVAVPNTVGGLSRVAARVVLFDSDLDIALLRIADTSIEPLPLGDGESGDEVGVFGHPEGIAAVRIAPARIAGELDALGKDLYGLRETTRRIFMLAADLEPGDSGSALVDRAGEVVGVAFAISNETNGEAYALTSVGIKTTLARYDDNDSAVVTTVGGPCVE